MSNDFKLIPYGISNFKQVREENKYLVDKTRFFEQLELAGNFFYLVRPRRFGKSLFLNMLEAYYDINEKDNFDKLFHGLYVADHPTEYRNRYQVMHLDFSQVGSDVERLQENFDFYLSISCESFAEKYARFYPGGFVDEVKRIPRGEQKLNYINFTARRSGCNLYLIVDEYDNYCFAKDSFGREPSMFNSDMVCYYLSNLVGVGQRPEELIDPNTMTDYGKLKRLIKIDKTEGKRIEIIHDIAEKGFIKARLVSHFPAEKMMEFGNFVSLLYYYGMLTIGGVVGDRLKLIIPNNNVRLQYYQYLLDEYSSIHSIDISDLDDAFDEAALEGDWQPLISFICKAYHDTTAIRQLIEGERNLQGFMNAYLTLTNYYLVAPEMEFSHGYCDFFLLPNYAVYPMVRHSYILELKYLKADATDAEADRQWSEAQEQIKTYAADKKLQSMLHGTLLHPIVVQIKGYDLVRFEEIN